MPIPCDELLTLRYRRMKGPGPGRCKAVTARRRETRHRPKRSSIFVRRTHAVKFEDKPKKLRFLFKLLVGSFVAQIGAFIVGLFSIHLFPPVAGILLWAGLILVIVSIILMGLVAKAVNRNVVVWKAGAVLLWPLCTILMLLRMYEIVDSILIDTTSMRKIE